MGLLKMLAKLLPEAGSYVTCPCCGWKGESYVPYGTPARKNARCPQCLALERHRFFYLYFKKYLPRNKKLRFLHFAPEQALVDQIKRFKNIDYLSVDIDPKKAMQVEDITKLSFEDESFDILYCCHVLEHIEDDRKAISELYRVLKKDGLAIIQVPVRMNLEKTFEDPSITDPQERLKVYGQTDHVRNCGLDYVDRIREGGFKVKVSNGVEELSEAEFEKYFLRKADISYYCSKTK